MNARRVTVRGTLAVGVLVLAAVASAALAVGWQLSRPVPSRVGPPLSELAARPISFPSQSGSTIHGWFSSVDSPRGAVLLLPPVRSTRLAMVGRAVLLRNAGYATLAIDLQGTGESWGEAITFGWRERHDVLAAVQFLRQQQPHVPVVIIGVSLGGAAALLATPPLTVDAMVLEAVYPTITRAVENRMRMRLGALGPWLSPLLLMQLQPRLGAAPAQLRPVDHIRFVRCPILIIGGAKDRHTTEADTRALYAAAPDPRHLWIIPGAAHVDYLQVAREEYRQRVLDFFAEALGARHAAAEAAPRQLAPDRVPR